MEKVSVIIPLYNTEKYISEALKSCFVQTWPDIEIIVINDGSTDSSLDRTEEIIKTQAAGNVRMITTPNRGLSAARNEGIRCATGEYICFLDSDDSLEPDLVKACVCCMQKNNLDMVTFDCLAFNDDGYGEFESIVRQSIRVDTLLHGRIYTGLEFARAEQMSGGIHIAAWQTFYRRQFLEDKGIWFTEGAFYEDNAFHFKCLFYANRVMYLPKLLYRHRLRNGSIMKSDLNMHKVWSLFDISDAILSTMKFDDQKEANRSGRRLNSHWMEYAAYLLSGLIRVVEKQVSYKYYREIVKYEDMISRRIEDTLKQYLSLYCRVSRDDSAIDCTFRLLYEFAHCFDFYNGKMREMEGFLKDAYICQKLRAVDVFYRPELKIGLYGSGNYADFLLCYLDRIRTEEPDFFQNQYVFIDSDKTSHTKTFRNHDVIHIKDAEKEGIDAIVLFSFAYEDTMRQYACAYAPRIPIYFIDGKGSSCPWDKGHMDFYFSKKLPPLDGEDVLRNPYLPKLHKYPSNMEEKRRIFLLCTPRHDNIGDYLITLAEQKFFKRYFPKYELLEIDENRLLQERDSIFDEIRLRDLVAVTGGGFIGLWDHRNNMEHILRHCYRNKIVIFPHSVYFGDIESMRKLQILNGLIAKCHDITFIAREKNTYEFLQRYAPQNMKLEQIPDIAFSLGFHSFGKDRHGGGIFLREDKESAISRGDRMAAAGALREKTGSICESSMHMGETIRPKNERGAIYAKLAEIAGYKLVITDMLHCMISCALTGTPCIAVNNITRKVEGVYEQLRGLPYIRFAADYDELIRMLHKGELIPVEDENVVFDYEVYIEQLKGTVDFS